MSFSYHAFQQNNKYIGLHFKNENQFALLKKYFNENVTRWQIVKNSPLLCPIIFLEVEYREDIYETKVKFEHLKQLENIIAFVNTLEHAEDQDPQVYYFTTVTCIDDYNPAPKPNFISDVSKHYSTQVYWDHKEKRFQVKTHVLVETNFSYEW